jgi:enoyl-CoA hydratase
MADESEVRCERQGRAGVITLARPDALNALTLGMVRAITRALLAWRDDPAVTRILIESGGGRAFCAGGDIRQLYEAGKAQRFEEALSFWREEYALNLAIQRYPKPYVALIDGIVMGGGVGVSLHGRYRVAGERYVFAMPEVGIGFFPDVGATYALPRLPGSTGSYLALTGERVRSADAKALGLATHAVASADLPALRQALIDGEPVASALARFDRDPGEAPLAPEREIIEACFAPAPVGTILERLDAAAARSGFAEKAAATMRQKSPTSLAIAAEQMRRGAGLDLEEALRIEFRIVSRILRGHDFYEGVRATIIDRGNRPAWRPASVAEVDPAAVLHYFEPLGAAEWSPA